MYDIQKIYIRSDAMTATNRRFDLNAAYEKLKILLDIWDGPGSGWIIDKIDNIWINMSNYDPLVGRSYIPLPPELNNSMKGLINLKNKDIECFKWCHVRFINPQSRNSDRINKKDKKIAETLDYRGINFSTKARDYEIVKERFNIDVNFFGYENIFFPLYVPKKSNEQVLNVLLISNEEKSRYVFIKDLNRLMYSKTKNKDRKYFCMSCLQNFSTKEILNKHKEQCLLINDTQTIKYETGKIKFKNFDKQIPIPFKIYADTECLLKRIDIKEGKYAKLYQKHISNSTGAKLFCIDDRFTLPTKPFTGNNSVNDFIKWGFIQQKRINQIIDNHFNKKLKMTMKNENNYQNSEICWICSQKIIKDKVRDHCHITGKFRGAAHKECNSKLRIPRKLPIIFQVIPKSSEKYMSIIISKNIIFLDSLQFYKGSLDCLAGNLQDSDFKHLMSEFPPNKLEILRKTKCVST